jgi:two-component system, OmpR family, alkaline phosphatase synthesis response regulator PhoP
MTRILVIHAGDLTCCGITANLTRMGYATIEACSAATGIQAAREVDPDLVLVDFRLPDHDGLCVLAALREADPALPVVLLGSRRARWIEHCALRLGARACLDTPIDAATLAAIVAWETKRSAHPRWEREAGTGRRCRDQETPVDPVLASAEARRRPGAGRTTP